MTSVTMTHLASGENHTVAAELRVLVMPSVDGGFFAQGLEVDYVATGATEEDARNRFARGFVATIQSYLRRGRDLGSLFAKARTPPEYIQAYFQSATKHVLRCAVTEVPGLPPDVAIPRTLSFCSADRPRKFASS